VGKVEAGGSEQAVAHARREVLVETGRREVADVFRHADLLATQRFEAPSIVEYPGGTLFVPPGWRGLVDGFGNVHLSRVASSEAPVDAVHSQEAQEVLV
jgi:N-methylhydantoinase A